MKDEIITELWRVKDEIAREVDGNVQTLFKRLQERQKTFSNPRVDRTGLKLVPHFVEATGPTHK